MKHKVEEFTMDDNDGEVPVAYIDLTPNRTKYAGVSKRQIVFPLPTHFTPSELIVDIDSSGRVLGIEIL